MATFLYDAIVDTDSKLGDYTLPSAAFAAGKTSIFVRRGFYSEVANVVVPNGGSMMGEAKDGVIIDFSGTSFSVTCDSNPSSIQTAGTIALTNNSAAVVGTGTSFTNLSPGDFISVGATFMQISSVTDDHNLTLVANYQGATVTGLTYMALTMFSGINMTNILIQNSSSYGLYMRGCRQFELDSITVNNCTPNIYLDHCGDSNAQQILTQFSVGVGINISNALAITLNTVEATNSTSHGMAITGTNCRGLFITKSVCSINAGSGIYANGSISSVNFSECSLKRNNASGIYLSSGCSSITLNGAIIMQNNTYGAEIYGSDTIVSGCVCSRNVSHGFYLAGNECSITGNTSTFNNDEGIRISGNDNIVSLNICRNNTTYAMHITVGATDNLVNYNNLQLAGSGTIFDEGMSTDTTGNKA
jgi:hypothetical protein